MRRLLAGLLCALLAAPAWAVTNVYIDAACPTAGNGTGGYTATCDGTAAGNPHTRIESWIATGEACDTIVHILGIHDAHDSCPGSTDGRYFGNEWGIDANGCTSGTPIIVQPYNYSGLGTGEVVYLDGTRCPHPTGCLADCDYTSCLGQDGPGKAWEQCDWNTTYTPDACDCDANHLNIQIGGGGQTACEETWFTSDDGTAGTGFQGGSAANALWAQKDDGSPTYLAGGANLTAALADMTAPTTPHSGYLSARCSNPNDATQTYQPCVTDADCTRGGTCSATSPEVDSLRDHNSSPQILFVRWGSSLPTRPYVAYSGAGNSFALKAASDYVTIRGLVMRAHRGPNIWLDEGSTNNTVQGNLIIFVRTSTNYDDGSAGNAYGVVGYGGKSHSIIDNEISFTNDEGLHTQGSTDATASSYIVQRNYIHHTAWKDIDGIFGGTGSGIIVGCNQSYSTSEDFTGTDISNNLFAFNGKIGASGQTANGIRMENCISNSKVHDNIVRSPKDACLVLDGSDDQSNANHIYNNLFQGCGSNGIEIHCLDDCVPGANNDCSVPESVEDNLIYNNTVANPVSAGLSLSFEAAANCGGAGDENLIVNNIFSTTGSQAMVSWTDTEANTFTNNSIHTTHATPVTWLNTGYSCANVNSGCSGNCTASICSATGGWDAFVSSTDFHLTSGSPAKDAGTSTGMPSGRTADINNTLSGAHGLGSYADAHSLKGAAWDIGADEFNPGCASVLGGKVTIAGKVTACSP